VTVAVSVRGGATVTLLVVCARVDVTVL